MYKNLIKTSTLKMTHEEWLEERRRGVGGSDASAIIGLNAWSSPYSVWAEKLGLLPEKEDNESMRLGRDLEDYVAKRFTEATGKRVRRENNTIRNPDIPFAHANVDRMVIGEDAGLECKTTKSLNIKKFKNGDYPVNYYCQAVHYMMVTGCKRWYLAVLVLGEGFYHYVIERDEAEIEALKKSEEEFWTYVQSKTPPMVDGTKPTTDAIAVTHPDSNEETVNLVAYERELAEYMAISSQITALEERKKEAANKVKVFMDKAGKGESDRYKVSWTTAEKHTFDSKRFAAENPGIDLANYYKKSTYRTFKVTEIGA